MYVDFGRENVGDSHSRTGHTKLLLPSRPQRYKNYRQKAENLSAFRIYKFAIAIDSYKVDKHGTARQVNDWLESHRGFCLNVRYLAEVLNRNGLSYKRTTRHKQNPEQVASKKADLEALKKGQSLD